LVKVQKDDTLSERNVIDIVEKSEEDIPDDVLKNIADARAVIELPPGWIESVDPSSGNPYYFNQKEGITSWEKPLIKHDDALGSEALKPMVGKEENLFIKPNLIKEISVLVEDALLESESLKSKEDVSMNNVALSPEDSVLPSGWIMASDPSSGKTYYYNEVEGVSSWEKPVASSAGERDDVKPQAELLKKDDVISQSTCDTPKECKPSPVNTDIVNSPFDTALSHVTEKQEFFWMDQMRKYVLLVKTKSAL